MKRVQTQFYHTMSLAAASERLAGIVCCSLDFERSLWENSTSAPKKDLAMQFMPRPASATVCCALAALPLCALPARPVPATVTGTADAIRAMYSQINAELPRRDLDGAMSLFTPDYALIDEKGKKLTRAQAIQDYRDTMRDVRSMQTTFNLVSLTPVSGGAWADMKMYSQGTGQKRVLFTRIRGTFTNDLHVRDFWVPTPQGWRLKYRQTLQDETRTHPG